MTMSNTKGESEAIERVESNVPSIAGVGKDDYQGKRVDDALQFALERGQTTWTIEEEKKILRKIDMVLLPLMFIGMCIAYADTQAYGFAALFGLVEDLNLFTVSGIIKGQTVIDTTRYQFSAGITALGSMAVSKILNVRIVVLTDLRRANIPSLPWCSIFLWASLAQL